MTALHDLTAADLSSAYRARELSPVEVTRAALARIEAWESKINAMYLVWADAALAQATASEARWRAGTPLSALDGVPITIKDIITVAGIPTPVGTAAGDMTATTLHLGFFGSIWLFAGLIAIPAIGYRRFGMNEVLAFWVAYVLTRPLGASVADWLAVSGHRGGLGLGTGGVSLILAASVYLAVRRLAATKMDVRGDDSDADGSGPEGSDAGRLGRGRALGLDLG